VPYDNLGKIGKVKVPVMIIHGSQDEIIPVDMARRVFAAAPEPKELYIIPGAHHNDTYLVGGPEYFERLRAFIEGDQATDWSAFLTFFTPTRTFPRQGGGNKRNLGTSFPAKLCFAPPQASC
jgi:dienelactone hydrolase